MSPRTADKTQPSFEQATARLEEIIARMDAPETGLEEMISLVEEGLALITRSRKLLADAELRIRNLENPEPSPDAPKRRATPQDDGFSLI